MNLKKGFKKLLAFATAGVFMLGNAGSAFAIGGGSSEFTIDTNPATHTKADNIINYAGNRFDNYFKVNSDANATVENKSTNTSLQFTKMTNIVGRTNDTGWHIKVPQGTTIYDEGELRFIYKNAMSINGKLYDVQADVYKFVAKTDKCGFMLFAANSRKEIGMQNDSDAWDNTRGISPNQSGEMETTVKFTIIHTNEDGTVQRFNNPYLAVKAEDIDLSEGWAFDRTKIDVTTDVLLNGSSSTSLYASSEKNYIIGGVDGQMRPDSAFWITNKTIQSGELPVTLHGQASGWGVSFFLPKANVTYKTDGNGNSKITSQEVNAYFKGYTISNPTYSVDNNYEFNSYVVDKNVKTDDGRTFTPNDKLTDEDLNHIVLTEDLTITARFSPIATFNVTKTSDTNYIDPKYPYAHWVIEASSEEIGAKERAELVEDKLKDYNLELVEDSVKTSATGEGAKVELVSKTKDLLSFNLKNSTTEASTFKVEFDTKIKPEGFKKGNKITNALATHPRVPEVDVPIKHSITTSAVNGTITPSSIVESGSDVVVNYTPNNGYELTKLTVDGKIIEDFTKFITEFTFEKVSEDHVIDAQFSKKKFNITTEVEGGVGGRIDEPSVVEYNDDKTVTFEPTKGYELRKVTVDGTVVTPTTPNSHAFEKVQDNHKIVVSFSKIPEFQLSKTAEQKDVQAGELAHYTVNVKQISGDTTTVAKNVILKDTLDTDKVELVKDSIVVEGTSADNYTIEEANEKGFKIVFKRITDAEKDSIVVKYDAKVKTDARNSTELNNTVSVTAENNPSIVTTNEKINSIIPDLDIVKTVITTRANNSVVVGDKLDYTVEVKNKVAGTTAKGVVVKDKLPEGIKLVGDAKASDANAIVSYDESTREIKVEVPTLSDGLKITYKAEVTALTGALENTASVIDKDFMEFPKTSSAVVNVLPARLNIEKIVDKAQIIKSEVLNYTVKASIVKDKTMADKAINAVIADTLPANAELIEDTIKINGIDKDIYTLDFEKKDGKIVGFKLTVPEMTEDVTITYSMKTDKAKFNDTVLNEATLTHDNSADKTPQKSATITKIENEPVAFIAKEITNASKYNKIDDYVEYKLNITKQSRFINDVNVTDTLPKGLELDKDSVKVNTEDKFTVDVKDNKFTVDTARMNKDFTITYRAKITEYGTFKNIATLKLGELPPTTAEVTTKLDKPATTPNTGVNSSVAVYAFAMFASAFAIALRKRAKA